MTSATAQRADRTHVVRSARGVLGLDAGCLTLRAADAAAHAVVALLVQQEAASDAVVASHLVRRPGDPRVALSVEVPALAPDRVAEVVLAALPGAVLHAPASAAGVQAHRDRSGGRLVHFPGVEHLVGTLAVSELLAGSAIDDVHVLGGTGPAAPGVRLVTRDHVRPAWSAGRLVLAAEWAAGGTLVPFETPSPTPCCVDHA